MGNINLSWDLFILVFFFIIVAYSVMIGKAQTTKVILSSYIAILASDAIGGLIARGLANGGAVGAVIVPHEDKTVVLLKIAVFVVLTVALTTRGAFDIVMADERSGAMRVMMMVAYGILSAGLIVSTILIYVSGISLFAATSMLSANPIKEIAGESRLVALMIKNYAIWFSLPALAFVVSSFFGRRD